MERSRCAAGSERRAAGHGVNTLALPTCALGRDDARNLRGKPLPLSARDGRLLAREEAPIAIVAATGPGEAAAVCNPSRHRATRCTRRATRSTSAAATHRMPRPRHSSTHSTTSATARSSRGFASQPRSTSPSPRQRRGSCRSCSNRARLGSLTGWEGRAARRPTFRASSVFSPWPLVSWPRAAAVETIAKGVQPRRPARP